MGKRVLSGRHIAGVGAAKAEGFEMAYKRAIAGARLGEVAHTPQMRDQRQHGFDRCRAALEGGALTQRWLGESGQVR